MRFLSLLICLTLIGCADGLEAGEARLNNPGSGEDTTFFVRVTGPSEDDLISAEDTAINAGDSYVFDFGYGARTVADSEDVEVTALVVEICHASQDGCSGTLDVAKAYDCDYDPDYVEVTEVQIPEDTDRGEPEIILEESEGRVTCTEVEVAKGPL